MRTRTIAFHGGKGGVGTTTLAAETAALLSRYGRKVVAVDLDLYRGDLHCRLDTPVSRGTHTLIDVFQVLDEVDGRVLENALEICPCGARLLPAPASSIEARGVQAPHVTKLLHALAGGFDHVIIDTSPALSEVVTAALKASDLIVLVVTPEVACLGDARKALDEMRDLELITRLVVNRSLRDIDSLTEADIEAFLISRVTAVMPEDTARCRRTGDEGRLLTTERSAVGQAIEELVHRFAKMPG
jgi:MinD-like ATPase involved in chromosome partitioning or flagellar assembly